MNYFKIQPDNLSKKQKKTYYVWIVILLIILIAFFGYVKMLLDYESSIREGEDFVRIKCEIIEYGFKFNSTVFKYTYQNNEYRFSQSFTDELKVGEEYFGRLNIFEPGVAFMLLDEPIIDTIKYKLSLAKILEITPKEYKLNLVTYSYKLSNKEYVREQYVSESLKVRIDENVSILYKINNPKISYLKK